MPQIPAALDSSAVFSLLFVVDWTSSKYERRARILRLGAEVDDEPRVVALAQAPRIRRWTARESLTCPAHLVLSKKHFEKRKEPVNSAERNSNIWRRRRGFQC